MKKAFITGICGQDGFYLSDYLQQLGYEVRGVDLCQAPWTQEKNIHVEVVNLLDREKIYSILSDFCPDEIYHLAAYHYSSEQQIDDDVTFFSKSYEHNVLSTLYLLDWIKKYSPQTRLFYAGTSHMFGKVVQVPQNENTPFNPQCPYGLSKYMGMRGCEYYRKKHGIFASVGILYNHESPRRSPAFVSQKIVKGAVAIKQEKQKSLLLGDLKKNVDWGYAGDYVRAMHMILQHRMPDTFVISSGQKHTVFDFVDKTFSIIGLDWKSYVQEDKSLLRADSKGDLLGDSSKLQKELGWQPEVSFEKLVEMMVLTEQKRWHNETESK